MPGKNGRVNQKGLPDSTQLRTRLSSSKTSKNGQRRIQSIKV